MIDPNLIKDNPTLVKKAALSKGVDLDIDQINSATHKAKELQTKVESLRNQKNDFNLKLRDKKDPKILKQATEIKKQLEKLEEELKENAPKIKEEYYKIPNLPAPDVKEGEGESGNEVIKKFKEPTKFEFTPKDHLEIGGKLDLIDTQRSAKVSGSRFAYLKNEAVLLEFALVQLALTTLVKDGFTPVIPPVLIKKEITSGLGYWQGKGNEDYYQVSEPDQKEDFYLVGTAEHTLVPMHQNEVFEKSALPKRYVGFSTCFRREAGSYGQDTKGIIRVHQFDKVEMVSFTTEENDDHEHEFLLSLEEKLFQLLQIPYQVIKMGSGDLGFPVARKYDIEAWIPSQNKYREVTSVSTTTSFQARRLNIRYRTEKGTEFAHILNGTAFAMPRTLVAILENYQQADGSVKIPEVLIPYVGLDKITLR